MSKFEERGLFAAAAGADPSQLFMPEQHGAVEPRQLLVRAGCD